MEVKTVTAWDFMVLASALLEFVSRVIELILVIKEALLTHRGNFVGVLVFKAVKQIDLIAVGSLAPPCGLPHYTSNAYASQGNDEPTKISYSIRSPTALTRMHSASPK